MRSRPGLLVDPRSDACSNWTMVATSRTLGMRCSVTGSSVSRQAASAGKAEFFAVGRDFPAQRRAAADDELSILRASETRPRAARRRSSAASRAIPSLAITIAFSLYHRGVEQLRRAIAIGAAGFGDDAHGTLAQLGVGRLHVYHQVAVDVPSWIMTAELSMFSTSLVAVPAFMRVEPGDDLRP